MARIRTIKPEFFRHEALFEAEAETGLPLRIAFAGLWTVCDRDGRFRWQPRVLKLDVLPFDECNFAAVLDALAEYGFVARYEVDGTQYGHIPSWRKHQQVNVREQASVIPAPAGDKCEHEREQVHAHDGSSGEGEGEGKGREQEEKTSLSPPSGSTADAVPAKPEKPKPPPCPYERIVDAYHEVLPAAPRVVVLTDQRREHIQARWRQVWEDEPFDASRGVELFRGYFQRVSQSKFLTGKTTRKDNGRPFVADLAWLVRPENFAKVIEGKYT